MFARPQHLVELEDACVAQRHRGGRLHARILDFSGGGVPVGSTLDWANRA